jgi:hypothetical protein
MLRQPPTSPDGNQIPAGHNATAQAGVLAVLSSDSRKARDDLLRASRKPSPLAPGRLFLTDGRLLIMSVRASCATFGDERLPELAARPDSALMCSGG